MFYISDNEADHIAAAQTIEDRRNFLIHLARTANLPLLTKHFDGSIRYCFNCRCIKPDRAHHCSICRKCVLKYDHHCPWTNSCVSFGNYKFFILFLGYALIFCIYVAATSIEYFIKFWQNVTSPQQDTSSLSTSGAPSAGKFHLLFLFFASVMFAVSVSTLFFYHLYLIWKNRTTLESFRSPIFIDGPNKNGFDLGYKQNFFEIFGSSLLLAILPVTSTGDALIPIDSNTSYIDDRGIVTQSNYSNTGDYLLTR
ncbi:unnamed protein product [Didymodactylos carnosus]|uniref:Palmitoyltransferase n=1 Tax=Didymodactylos carnosus TaxID=1234261 RepID=A0A815T822_9BILA|nr:unnamed protein product [Didymodactylos carnosus]CAF4364419.1 unnamed protein product [Didymodactylos carnosus]